LKKKLKGNVIPNYLLEDYKSIFDMNCKSIPGIMTVKELEETLKNTFTIHEFKQLLEKYGVYHKEGITIDKCLLMIKPKMFEIPKDVLEDLKRSYLEKDKRHDFNFYP